MSTSGTAALCGSILAATIRLDLSFQEETALQQMNKGREEGLEGGHYLI
jgi:hypothetical protein